MTLYFILYKNVYRIWMLNLYYRLKMTDNKRFDYNRYVKFFFISYSRNRWPQAPIRICWPLFRTIREEHCSIHISDYDWPVSFDCFSVLVINIRIDKIYLIVLVNILASSFWYNTSWTLFVNVQLAWNIKRNAFSREIVKRLKYIFCIFCISAPYSIF